jgi:hypothetical protein
LKNIKQTQTGGELYDNYSILTKLSTKKKKIINNNNNDNDNDSDNDNNDQQKNAIKLKYIKNKTKYKMLKNKILK